MKLTVTVNGVPYSVDVEVEHEDRPTLGTIITGGNSNGPTPTAPTTSSVQGVSANSVTAPLAGSVSKVLVEEGQVITAGEVIVVLEAMKMETEITAPNDGTVTALHVQPGDAVQGGQSLLEIGD